MLQLCQEARDDRSTGFCRSRCRSRVPYYTVHLSREESIPWSDAAGTCLHHRAGHLYRLAQLQVHYRCVAFLLFFSLLMFFFSSPPHFFGNSILDDNWTAISRDGSLSAQFEHTILITDNGPEILTK